MADAVDRVAKVLPGDVLETRAKLVENLKKISLKRDGPQEYQGKKGSRSAEKSRKQGNHYI